MKQFSKLMLIALGFGILTLALSLVPSKPVGAAGSAPVMVTNTPLPVQGTVNVGNTPSVNVANAAVPVQGTVGATQNGPWNVGINGTPNVNIANTPNVNIGSLPAVQLASGTTVGISGTPSVNVNNSAASPLFVQDPGSGLPFVALAGVQIAAGQFQGQTELMSPHGFLTVIESISGSLLLPPDLPPGIIFGVGISVGAGNAPIFFPGKPLPSVFGTTYVFHERTQLYIDEDHPIDLFVQGTGPFSSAQTAVMVITGRLLFCPLPVPSVTFGSVCGTSRLIQP